MPFKYMKTYAMTLLFVGVVITGFTQNLNASDTGVTTQELVITTSSASTPDRTVANVAREVVKKELDPFNDQALLTLHPRAIPFVKDYFDENEERLTKMKSSAVPYFRTIDNIFRKYQMPTELKYLAVIESELKSSAKSWAGAVGPWQFMPETGRLMGLTVNKHRDDRRDLSKSSVAAARYLKDLYAELGDWLLVIAAYNGGPGRVEYAIRKSGSRNFWDLQYYLPAESRTHVKKFIATHYIMEGQGGVTTTGAGDVKRLGSIQPSQAVLDNTLLQTVTGKYSAAIIAKNLNMDLLLFNQLNPGFDSKVASDSYGMKLPTEKMELFNTRKLDILNESVQFQLSAGELTTTADNYPKEISLPKQTIHKVRK
jgi:membrane-bound lytic murein transglycosylase D